MGESLDMCKQSSAVCKSVVEKVVSCFLCPWYVERGVVNLNSRRKDSDRYQERFLRVRKVEHWKTLEISEKILGSGRESMHPQAMMLGMTWISCLGEENNLGNLLMSLPVLCFSSIVVHVLFQVNATFHVLRWNKRTRLVPQEMCGKMPI